MSNIPISKHTFETLLIQRTSLVGVPNSFGSKCVDCFGIFIYCTICFMHLYQLFLVFEYFLAFVNVKYRKYFQPVWKCPTL